MAVNPLRRASRTAAAIVLAAAGFAAPAANATPAAASGCSGAGAGKADINGDGYDDVVIGDPSATSDDRSGAGAVTVLYGGKGGVGSGGSATLTAGSPGVAPTAPDGPRTEAGAGFGWSVATAHIDDDPCLDVVIGAPWRDAGGRADAGAAYVVYGSPQGIGRGRAGTALTPAAWKDGPPGALFGFSVAASDATGADRSSVAVGAPFTDRGGKKRAGAAYVTWFGTGGAPGNRRAVTEDDPPTDEGALPEGLFGWSVALGSLFGDPRRQDLIVGAPRVPKKNDPHPGALVLVGDAARPNGPVRALGPDDLGVPRAGNARIGFSVAFLGGAKRYLAVGAPGAQIAGHPNAGAVPLLTSDGRAFTRQEVVTEGTHGSATAVENSDQYGRSVALGRDGHGGVRLGVGTPYETTRVRHDGAAQIVPVSGGGRARDLNQTTADVPGDPGESAHFGWTVRFAGAEGTGPFLVGVPDDRGRATGAVIAAPDRGRPWRIAPPPASLPLDFGAAL